MLPSLFILIPWLFDCYQKYICHISIFRIIKKDQHFSQIKKRIKLELVQQLSSEIAWWSEICRNMIKTNASSWGQKSFHLATEYLSISPLNHPMINWTSSVIKIWMNSFQSLNSQGQHKLSRSCLMHRSLIGYHSQTIVCYQIFFPFIYVYEGLDLSFYRATGTSFCSLFF